MLPGILGGAPRSPYPISGGITNLRFSPSHILLVGIHNKRSVFVYNIR